MSNMSHCRFKNTASDFAECEDILSELLDGGYTEEPLSADELEGAKRLMRGVLALALKFRDRIGPDAGDIIKMAPRARAEKVEYFLTKWNEDVRRWQQEEDIDNERS